MNWFRKMKDENYDDNGIRFGSTFDFDTAVEMSLVGILTVVNKINRETSLCAWYSVSGHVGWIEVQVTKTKFSWEDNDFVFREKASYIICNDTGYSESDVIEALRRLKQDLCECMHVV